MDDVDILLWEWDFDVVFVERIVDERAKVALYKWLLCNINPCAKNEVYTAITKVGKYSVNSLLCAKSLYFRMLYSIYDKLSNLCRIASICNSERNLR